MAGGGGAQGGGGLLQGLLKPIMTGRGDPLGLVPELPNRPSSLDAMAQLPTMAPPQTTDRLAFLRSFGIQG
jgi:hypothetical protein